MLHGGVAGGGLELRRTPAGGATISGRFPYGVATTLGRGRRETVAPGAFRSAVESGGNVWFLIGHDPDRPLASRQAGTLELRDTDEALTFSATLSAELRAAPYVADALAGLEAGLIRGVSPGFRLAEGAGAETVRTEGDMLVRTVHRAELAEISLVTWPAYADASAQVEARNWQIHGHPPAAAIRANAALAPWLRWRA